MKILTRQLVYLQGKLVMNLYPWQLNELTYDTQLLTLSQLSFGGLPKLLLSIYTGCYEVILLTVIRWQGHLSTEGAPS